MRLTKKFLVVAVLFAGSMTAAALIYKSRVSIQSDTPLTTNATLLTSNPEFAFAIHPQPQALKEFMFVDDDSKAASLTDFRGKVVLLNIWATWCGPCRVEMPTLDRLQAMLGGPDFEVVALSIDQGGVPVVKDFYEELELKALRIFVDPSMTAPVALNTLGVPTTLLINREGQEIGRYTGPAEWDSPKVEALIRWYQKNRGANR
jgi:thiol-disulfide isomerase/thioredoxin